MKRKQRICLALASCAALLVACDGRLKVLEPGISGAGGQSSHADADAGSSNNNNNHSALPDAGSPGPMPTATCQDSFKNAGETDVDCGGPLCQPCPLQATCTGHPDCVSGTCRAGVCQAPACDDGLQNGDETGLDCGGACEFYGLRCVVPPSACNCASSAGLLPVACGSGLDLNSSVFATPDGATLAFALEPRVAYRWTAASGPVQLEEPGLHFPLGLSDDGTVILLGGPYRGSESSAGLLWTAAGAPTDIVTGGTSAEVRALSADGTIVLGNFDFATATGFVWRVGGEAEPIRDLSTASHSAAFMTPDGTVVGGRRTEGSQVQLFRWDSTNGAQSLGPLPRWEAAYRNSGVVFSRDGSAIAGFVAQSADPTAATPNQIFRWTEATGIVVLAVLWHNAGVLGTVTGDQTADSRLWLNDDGSALVGTFDLDPDDTQPQPSAFRWTEAGGSVALAATPGQQSIVRDASGDLSVVVGYTFPEQRPFVWNAANGLRELTQALSDAAIDLDGWELSKPAALSRDGKVVVGRGTCGGLPAVYRAVLPD